MGNWTCYLSDRVNVLTIRTVCTEVWQTDTVWKHSLAIRTVWQTDTVWKNSLTIRTVWQIVKAIFGPYTVRKLHLIMGNWTCYLSNGWTVWRSVRFVQIVKTLFGSYTVRKQNISWKVNKMKICFPRSLVWETKWCVSYETKHYNRLDPLFFMSAVMRSFKWKEMEIGATETCMFTSFYKLERPNDASLVKQKINWKVKQYI